MQDATAELWNWLSITDEPRTCDLIFLFGGSILETADKGAELYGRGLSRHIITTGNTGTFGNPAWTDPSAVVFAKRLCALGVPSSAILIEPKSMNTLEDVTYALPILDAEHIRHFVVTLVSRPVHQRRAYATYQLQDPGAQLINIPCIETHPSRLEGKELTDVAIRCCQEYERIGEYAIQGNLVAQVIPKVVEQAYRALKELLASESSI
jgi:uncharacterized SAM-binding protein YcdF (DUF218 family)